MRTDENASGKNSAKKQLREYFEAHVGEIIEPEVLQEVAGIRAWPRRIRELRREGMQILSNNDRVDIKPGQYILVSRDRLPSVEKNIGKLRAIVLQRDGYTCQMCGRGQEDPDALDPNRNTRLQVDHIDQQGENVESNLRTLCSACNEGRSDLIVSLPTINVLSQIRRCSRDQQREIYQYLKRKFEPEESA